MLLEAIAHRKDGLHGVELVLGLDLRRGQRHLRAMMDAMKGDLLDAGRNIMEPGVDEGALGVGDRRCHVRRQLEELQLHRQGWRSQKQKNYQDKDSRHQSKDVLGVHLTGHHDI